MSTLCFQSTAFTMHVKCVKLYEIFLYDYTFNANQWLLLLLPTLNKCYVLSIYFFYLFPLKLRINTYRIYASILYESACTSFIHHPKNRYWWYEISHDNCFIISKSTPWNRRNVSYCITNNSKRSKEEYLLHPTVFV